MSTTTAVLVCLGLALNLGGVGVLVWLVWRVIVRLDWLKATLVPWMNGISQRIGDDRDHPPIPEPTPPTS